LELSRISLPISILLAAETFFNAAVDRVSILPSSKSIKELKVYGWEIELFLKDLARSLIEAKQIKIFFLYPFLI
jgi:hypothetical protein